MEKKNSSAISVVMYVIGIIFLAIAAFMLVLAISYTRTYLESYDASFTDMWSNTIQYVIKEFAPYLGIGILCIGIGVAIKEVRTAREEAARAANATIQAAAKASADAPANKQAEEGSHPDYIKAMEKLEAGIKYLENDIDTTREILSIKIEEKEKRDAYRIRGLGADVMSVIESAQIEPVEPGSLKEQELAKPIALFRVAQTMAMPEIPKVKKTRKAPQKKTAKATKAKAAKPIPLFRVAQTMAMPDIPKVKKKRKASQKKSQKAKKTKKA